MQSDTAARIFSKLNIKKENLNSVVLIEKGSIYFKSEAIIKIADELGGLLKVIKIGKFLPLKFNNLIYDKIAKFRYTLFGKRSECKLPSGSYSDRFIL